MMRTCPVCNDVVILYKTTATYERACKKGTMCSSCRTSRNNKSPNRNTKKQRNPSWTGYKDIPGKVLSRLKKGAEKRGLPFCLTLEEIWAAYQAQSGICRFSGVPLVWGVDASVDRINSAKGYSYDNIQIVHKAINMLKRDMDDEQFIQWCKLIALNSSL